MAAFFARVKEKKDMREPGANPQTPGAEIIYPPGDIDRVWERARLDMDGVPEFHRRVYELARAIPPGQTLTYGEIARRLGDPSQARAVGAALGANPFPFLVPCHRVLAANGRTGGFSAPGGVSTKLRILEIEGARANAIPTLFGRRA